MLLSALSVVYISTPESKAQGEENLSNSYVALKGDDDDTNGQKLGQSLVNGLIIVCVVAVMTFFIVLLYKYRCMKCLLGYLVLASTMLLGVLSSEMFRVAIDRYGLRIDKLSFALTIYNFALVGVLAIFYGKGIPPYIAQSYLIASSVIVAWHLSHFDPWTAWVLLILLALYDLFAVLTPCGPLKALVNLMQREDAPDMPGLLYEASLPNRNNGTRNSSRGSPTDNGSSVTEEAATATNDPSNTTTNDPSTPPLPNESSTSASPQQDIQQRTTAVTDTITESRADDDSIESTRTPEPHEPDSETSELPVVQSTRLARGEIPLALALANRLPFARPSRATEDDGDNDWSPEELQQLVEVVFPSNGWRILPPSQQRGDAGETRYAILDPNDVVTKVLFVNSEGRIFEDVRYRPRVTGRIPLALAQLNKLRLAGDGPQPGWVRTSENETPAPTENWTPEQLREEVEVVFPRNGRRIVRHSRQRNNEETRYAVLKPDGSVKRVLFVNNEGRVFEDLRDKNRSSAEAERKNERNSIRLGLGDFIFYSILVSKAALYSFTTFVACTSAIIIGLLSTLMILAFRRKALPALPISIFLGVSVYFVTRYAVQPWVEEVFIQRLYV